MDQLLSQEEIDALLSGLSDGDIESPSPEVEAIPEKKVEASSFDFVRYTKGKKENLPALGFIFDRFSKSFRDALALYIEKDVSVEYNPVQYIEYQEFIKTLPLPTNMNVVITENLKGFFIVIFDAKLIFAVLETIFGSNSVTIPKIEGREFTRIEFNVIKKLIEDVIAVEMEKAWSPVYEIRCKYSRSEMNPNYITMVSKEETVSICDFTIEVGDISGWMKVCIPYGILETIKNYLISTPSREDMDMRQKWFNQLRERIYAVPLDLKAVLGRKTMSLKDFLNVSEDYVIIVDRHVDDPIDVEVYDKTKFRGKLGIFKGNKAIRVEDIVQ